MFEHEQIEASDRYCPLCAFLKSTLTLMVIIVLTITMMIKKKLLGYTKTVDSVEIAL